MEGAERFKKISLGKLKSPPDLDQNAPRFSSNFFIFSLSFDCVVQRSWVLTVVDSVGEDGICVNFLVDRSKVSSSSSHHPHCGCVSVSMPDSFMCVIVRFFYLTSKVETRSSTFSSTEVCHQTIKPLPIYSHKVWFSFCVTKRNYSSRSSRRLRP